MSRRAAAPSRTILPDPKFHSEMLAKFMNVVMHSGKKSAAEHILYGAIDRIAEKTGRQGTAAIELLSQALDNVKPVVEVKSRRVGGATYQVPVEVRASRRQTLARNRWRFAWRMSCSTQRKTVVPPCASARTRTAWPRPTRPSPITAGKRSRSRPCHA